MGFELKQPFFTLKSFGRDTFNHLRKRKGLFKKTGGTKIADPRNF